MAFNGKIAVFLRNLKTSRTPSSDLFFFLRSLPLAEVKKTMRELAQIPVLKPLVFGNSFPTSPQNVLDWNHLNQAKADQDILVSAVEVTLFGKQIEGFLQHKARFERYILLANYDAATKELNAIEDEFGYSVWLLESKISLLELSEGVEAQKKYIKTIIDNPDAPPYTKTLIYMFSLKAEKNVTGERFDALLATKIPYDFKDAYNSGAYFYFHLGFFKYFDKLDLHAVLLYERGASIIDRYLTLVRIAQVVASRGEPNLTSVTKAVSLLCQAVRDPNLDCLSIFLKGEPPNLPDRTNSEITSGRRFLSILDKYTVGHYKDVLESTVDGLEDNEVIALVDIVVRSAVRSGVGTKELPLISQFSLLFKEYASVLSKEMPDSGSYDALLKLVQMFPQSAWAAELHYRFARERETSGTRTTPSSLFSELNGTCYSPRLLARSLSRRERFNRSNTISAAIEESITYKFLQLSRNADSENAIQAIRQLGVPESRALKYLAYQAIDRNNLLDAEQLLLESISGGDVLDKQEASVALINMFVSSGRAADAIKRTALTLVSNPAWHERIPLIPVLDTVERMQPEQREKLSKEIYLSVCYTLFSMFHDSSRDELKTIAAEEFLVLNEYFRPSKIKNAASSIEHEVLVYFLSHVCRPETLDSHVEFTSTLDIEDERIAILQWLSEIDDKNRSSYTKEIATITQRQVLLKGVQAVNKSKIYVDVEGVRTSALKDLADLYARFKSLPGTGSQVNDIVLQVTKTIAARSTGLFLMPRNERLAALKEFYVGVRDRFVSSNEYGLDVYLSVGIRHGTLSGQLRSVFEVERLVTQKGADGEYASNEYWLTALREDGLTDDETLTRVNNHLSQFSSVVDAKIAYLRNTLIQIRTEERNPEGLFDFEITNESVVNLNRALLPDAVLEEGLELVLDALWERMDNSLSQIRNTLNSDFKNGFSEAIDNCLAEIIESAGPAQTHRLRNAFISARTSLQNELQNIAAWFTRAARTQAAPFRIQYAVDVALEMIRRCYPRRNLQLTLDVDEDLKLAGEALYGIVNVLFFAFDNIMQHCGNHHVDPTANMVCRSEAKNLSITLQSVVLTEIDVEAENKRLHEYKVEIDRATTSDRVRGEGRTGLLKMSKIMRVDLRSKLEIHFGYTSNSQFELKLQINGGRIFL